MLKYGQIEVLVTGTPNRKKLVSEAVATAFEVKHAKIQNIPPFTPTHTQKYICVNQDNAKLLDSQCISGSLCRTSAVITSPKEAAHAYLLCELLKLHYERTPELSKLPVTIGHSLDGIISITVANHTETYSLLKDFDGLLMNKFDSLKEIWEKLEDDLYDEGHDLVKLLQSRVLASVSLAEIPEFNPHERVRRDLDLAEQTQEVGTLLEFRKEILNHQLWDTLKEFTTRYEKETKFSITLMGQEQDMPYEVRSESKKWLVLGASEEFTKSLQQDQQQVEEQQPEQPTTQQKQEEEISNFR
jgi:hypothetical protein